MSKRMFGAVAVMAAACLAIALGGVTPALAGLGQPSQGQLGLQLSATPLMDEISRLFDLVNIIITVIVLFVLVLMVWVMFRFNEKSNPTPSRTTHHTLLEVAWTIVPILILVAIALPSFHLLFNQYTFPKADVTIKAIGDAWFWEHEYVDDKVTVTSNIINDEDLLRAKLGEEAFDKKYGALEGAELHNALYTDSLPLWKEDKKIRRLSVDREIAVPVNKNVVVLVTSNDVIHQWAVPSFGAKQQAVPGRTAAVWFKPTKIGSFFGQCMVLCGKLHSAMPIVVRVVEQPVYDVWMGALKAKDGKKAQEILDADTASQAVIEQSVAQAQ
ncbi:cytochrome c oxidase subunit II [Hyphomicrobium sp.]|uniref:cytochrome c oxidase subunit II n=1 Tax=Hyphomicrobium sp. TaxID=82 RepID=UPI000FC34AF7|nr:cytochrome c oxidase subunit II [Hyphomicrobium sp.]RUO97321.1 MAG: cytochrome c oxidase subunit II [Hyphomicrobium sp.]